MIALKLNEKLKLMENIFFYWGSISSANIDSETPPSKTGEVSESDFNHTQKGTNIVQIKYIK